MSNINYSKLNHISNTIECMYSYLTVGEYEYALDCIRSLNLQSLNIVKITHPTELTELVTPLVKWLRAYYSNGAHVMDLYINEILSIIKNLNIPGIII